MTFKSLFKRLYQIPSDELSHDNWQHVQPCWNIAIGKRNFILTQPFSSLLVYLLGIETIVVSFLFLQVHPIDKTDVWWFISLFLWGLGALIAGTSYQAFGYYIKCYGRAECTWTSWWEVVYLLMQKLSVDAMLIAVGYSCLPSGVFRTITFLLTAVSAVAYVALLVYGSLKPVKRFITFEMMVVFCTPVYLFLIGFNSHRYLYHQTEIDSILLALWVSLVAIMVIYYGYLKLGWTEKLWNRKIWFSANDFLHIGLILWIAALGLYLKP
ncbi:MAG: hypothetical protein ACJAVL_001550 [Bacteroidia bacterium]|jgi:hypothetical protein